MKLITGGHTLSEVKIQRSIIQRDWLSQQLLAIAMVIMKKIEFRPQYQVARAQTRIPPQEWDA